MFELICGALVFTFLATGVIAHALVIWIIGAALIEDYQKRRPCPPRGS